jgi:hypothetical protein
MSQFAAVQYSLYCSLSASSGCSLSDCSCVTAQPGVIRTSHWRVPPFHEGVVIIASGLRAPRGCEPTPSIGRTRRQAVSWGGVHACTGSTVNRTLPGHHADQLLAQF